MIFFYLLLFYYQWHIYLWKQKPKYMTTYKVQIDNTEQQQLTKNELIEVLAATILQLAGANEVGDNLLMIINISNDNRASN
jgi:hypothetical protein